MAIKPTLNLFGSKAIDDRPSVNRIMAAMSAGTDNRRTSTLHRTKAIIIYDNNFTLSLADCFKSMLRLGL